MVCLCRKWVEEEGRRDYNIDKEGDKEYFVREGLSARDERELTRDR